LNAGRLHLSEFRKHGLKLGVVSTHWKSLHVKVVAVARLLVFVEGDLDFLSSKLLTVSFRDALVGRLLALKLNETKSARLPVRELFKLERLNFSVLGEDFPKFLLSQVGGQICDDDVGFVIETRLHDAHVDCVTVNLSVVHLLLASGGFFDGRELQEAIPLLIFLGNGIVLG